MLRLGEIVTLLQADVLAGDALMQINIGTALGTDLLSDVLATPRDETILITGLCNPQVIRTAEMVDIKAVILVHGKQPGGDMLRLAKEMNLPLLVTAHGLFQTCGMLYQAGLRA